MEERSFRLGVIFYIKIMNTKIDEKKIPDEFKKLAKDFSEKWFYYYLVRQFD